MFEGSSTHGLHVEAMGLGVDAVGDNVVELAGEVQFHAVGQVTTVGKFQAQEFFARRHQGVQDRSVGLGAGVGLDVGVLGSEESFGAGYGQVLGHVDVLAATVVTLADRKSTRLNSS